METKKTLKEMVSKINQVWLENSGYFAQAEKDVARIEFLSITNIYFTSTFTDWLNMYLEESGHISTRLHYSVNKEGKIYLVVNF